MKASYIFLLACLLWVTPLAAQPTGGQDVESLKIAFITRRLSLTPDEAKVFWPVYDAFAVEMKQVREGMHLEKANARQNFDEMSDKEIDAAMENMLQFKRKELDITLRYHEQFKKVLPIRKVAQLYRAEQQFTRMLLERLQERQAGGAPGGGPPAGGRPGGRRF